MYLEYLHVSPHLCNEYDEWQLLDPKVLDSGGGHTAKVPVDHVEKPGDVDVNINQINQLIIN